MGAVFTRIDRVAMSVLVERKLGLKTLATLHQREPERGWTTEQNEELLVGVGRGTDVQRLRGGSGYGRTRAG